MAQRDVKISDLQHFKIAGTRDTYVGWPYHGGICNFGGGEIALILFEADCAYECPEELSHYDIERRGRLVLYRSLDHGRTWPAESRVVVRDNRVPFESLLPEEGMDLYTDTEEVRHWAGQVPPWTPDPHHERIDMSGPDAMFMAWRWLKPVRSPTDELIYRPITFILRSQDKGCTWDRVPIIVCPYQHYSLNGCGGAGFLRLPDGAILTGFIADRHPPWQVKPGCTSGRSVLYCSVDDGLSWRYLSTLGYELHDEMASLYPHPIRLTDGRLMSALGYRAADWFCGWTSIVFSEDEGLTWSAPRRINRWGECGVVSHLLRDGRIVIIYTSRYEPFGIRGMLSEDQGNTWSNEFIIRDDGGCWDLGYPQVTQLDNGEIFVAYWMNLDEGGPPWQNRRFTAGSTFNVD